MSKELRELLAKATPGPWCVHPIMAWVSPLADLDLPICQLRMATDGQSCEPQAKDDAALIVAAVNSLPALLDRIVALEAQRDELGKVLVSFTPDGSEYYIRDGDGYRVDPERCRAVIREKLDAIHAARVELACARQALEGDR